MASHVVARIAVSLLILARFSRASSTITCDIINESKIRVTWYFDVINITVDEVVISWFNKDEFDRLIANQTTINQFIEYEFIQQGTSPAIYKQILNAVAANIGLSSMHHVSLRSTTIYDVMEGVEQNSTYDITVQATYNGIHLHKISNVNCIVTVPEFDIPTDMEDSDQWELFVIIPGALLAIVTAGIAVFMIYKACLDKRRKLKSTSLLHLNHEEERRSYSSDDTDEGFGKYRHYIVTASDCWTTPRPDTGLSSEGGDDTDSLLGEKVVIFDPFFKRHSLTTVVEESSESCGKRTSSIVRSVIGRKTVSSGGGGNPPKEKPKKQRIDTPIAPKRPPSGFTKFRRRMCSRSSKISDMDSVASSVSLWWQESDDEESVNDVTTHPTKPVVPNSYILSRQKKLRKVAPEKYRLDEEAAIDLLGDKEGKLLGQTPDEYQGVRKSSLQSVSTTRTGTRKSLLRSTASTMNIFK